MAMPEEPYFTLIVETYRESGSGLHGDIHVRCVEGQEFPPTFRIRFPMAPRFAHPVGSRFQILAKLSDKEGGNNFLHSNHAWPYTVLG